jgi:hypothetical protein
MEVLSSKTREQTGLWHREDFTLNTTAIPVLASAVAFTVLFDCAPTRFFSLFEAGRCQPADPLAHLSPFLFGVRRMSNAGYPLRAAAAPDVTYP